MSSGHDLNLPFEPSPRTQLPPEQLLLSGGVVVAAAALNDTLPGLLFRFAKHDGTGFHTPILIACDNVADLAALPALVEQAVTHAMAVTSRG